MVWLYNFYYNLGCHSNVGRQSALGINVCILACVKYWIPNTVTFWLTRMCVHTKPDLFWRGILFLAITAIVLHKAFNTSVSFWLIQGLVVQLYNFYYNLRCHCNLGGQWVLITKVCILACVTYWIPNTVTLWLTKVCSYTKPGLFWWGILFPAKASFLLFWMVSLSTKCIMRIMI